MDQQAGPDFLAGGGEMGALMRERDWSTTPLGMPAAWPVALRTLVPVMLGSKQLTFVAWGAEHRMLYNEGYAVLLGRKHPDALGQPLLDVWSEVRDDLAPIACLPPITMKSACCNRFREGSRFGAYLHTACPPGPGCRRRRKPARKPASAARDPLECARSCDLSLGHGIAPDDPR